MVKLEHMTKKAVVAYAKSIGKEVVSVRHIHPRAYVLARPASCCLVVATPLCDAEPQIRNSPMRQDGSTIVHCFDGDLLPGDWCSVAYVNTKTSGEQIAVPAVSQPAKCNRGDGHEVE